MALLTFKGGIHPDDGKDLAKNKEIVELKPKGDLIYPVSQHIGAPAKPIVAAGDHVLKGQMIAEAGGFVSAPVYASVSGTVKAIAPHLNPTGGTVNSIVVENDGEYEEVEYPEYPYSEVIGFTENGDGTLTLTANVVFPYVGDSKVYAHEVVVRPLENGGVQYVSNRIIPSEDNCEETWHTPRLTAKEWDEIYGGK